MFSQLMAGIAVVTHVQHANTTFADIGSFSEKWPMFVYTNIGLSQKMNELKISNSEHLYTRPVLVCVQKIIKFAQWQFDDICWKYIWCSCTRTLATTRCAEICSCTRTYTIRQQIYHIYWKLFPTLLLLMCTHICLLQMPHNFWLPPITLSFWHVQESRRSANAVFGCFQGRPLN